MSLSEATGRAYSAEGDSGRDRWASWTTWEGSMEPAMPAGVAGGVDGACVCRQEGGEVGLVVTARVIPGALVPCEY